MASPKAIVFDLDGVLLDSEPIYLGVERDLINEYLARVRVRVLVLGMDLLILAD